jgi:hypothetical protein
LNSDELISQLAEYNLQELYEELGSALLHGSVGFADDDPEYLGKFGEDWFKRNIQKIRERVCPNPHVQTLIGDQGGEKAVGFVTVVSGALGDITDTKQTATILAFIVLRYGIKRLCADYKSAG